MRTTAEAIAHQLKLLGARYVFQVTGGDQGLWLALDDQGISMIPCRTEQGAAYMADGYARASKEFAVVYGQHGPGATNVFSALADARWANSAVISLTSSISRNVRDKFAYQEVDQLLMHAAMTRYATEVSDPDEAPEKVARAVNEATRLPPQPTHVQVPRDLFDVHLAGKPQVFRRSSASPSQSAMPSPDVLDRVWQMLHQSSRPLIVAGSGVHNSEAYDLLMSFAETQNIPVATSLGGKGSVATSHPLSVGVVGRYSSKVANWAAGRADLILALGTRLGELTTDGQTVFPEAADIVQVDADPSSLAVAYPEAYGVLADAGSFLEQMTKRAELEDVGSVGRRAWSDECSAKTDVWRSTYARLATSDGSAELSPVSAIWELSECVEDGDAVVADTGYMSAWCGVLLNLKQAGHSFFRAAGSLGWAVPGAMGVALARKDNWVVAVTGDGGFAYNAFEIETAARCAIPVTIVVMNNRTLAFEYHLQKLKYERVLPHINDFTDVNYAQVAEDLGAEGRRVSTLAEFRAAIREGRASHKPFVIDVLIDKDAIAPVTSYAAVQEREL